MKGDTKEPIILVESNIQTPKSRHGSGRMLSRVANVNSLLKLFKTSHHTVSVSPNALCSMSIKVYSLAYRSKRHEQAKRRLAYVSRGGVDLEK